MDRYYSEVPVSPSTTKLAFVRGDMDDDYSSELLEKYGAFRRVGVYSWEYVVESAREINLTTISSIAFDGCNFLDIQNISTLMSALRRVKQLHIYQRASSHEYDIIDAIHMEIFNHCDTLKVLTYHFYGSYSWHIPILLQNLITRQPGLRKVNLNFATTCDKLTLTPMTSESYSRTPRRLNSIRLDVKGGMGVQFWTSLVRTSKDSLRKFWVRWYTEPPLVPANVLNLLGISSVNTGDWHCAFRNLKDLRLSIRSHLMDHGYFNFPQLEILHLSWQNNAKTSVNVYGGTFAGAESYLWILNNKRIAGNLLKVLDIDFIYHQEDSLRVISHSCRNLQILSLTIDFEVTQNGVTYLRRLTHLIELVIRYGSKGHLSDANTAIIISSLPSLRFLYKPRILNETLSVFVARADQVNLTGQSLANRFFISLDELPRRLENRNIVCITGRLRDYCRYRDEAAFLYGYFEWQNYPAAKLNRN